MEMIKSSSDHTTNLNYKLCNVVFSAKSEHIPIDALLVILPDIKQAGRNSSVHIWRDYATFMIQRSGRILIFKCDTIEKAMRALENLAQELEDNCLHLNMLQGPTICNMVATVNLGHSLNLGVLSAIIPGAEYFPDLHVSLFAKIGHAKATITHTGKVILFGCKSCEELVATTQQLAEMDQKYTVSPK